MDACGEDARRLLERQAERSQRRAAFLSAATDPLDALRINGHAAVAHVSAEQHASAESMRGFVPLHGKRDNLVERFDGRVLLDLITEEAGKAKETKATQVFRFIKRTEP